MRAEGRRERGDVCRSCKRLHEVHVGAEGEHAGHVEVLRWAGRGEGGREERGESRGRENEARCPTQAVTPTCRMHVRKMVPCMSSFSTAATRASSSERSRAEEAYLRGRGRSR